VRSSATLCSTSSPRSNAPLSQRGSLFVISGPSGVGKGTVVRRVLERVPGLVLSVSATTRRPRAGEREGVDYFFVDDAEFDRMIADGELLEWVEIYGHRSGTPARFIRERREAGGDVLLEIDVNGAGWVRKRDPEAVLIFLAPPSAQEQERRLRARGTEDPDLLARRLADAAWEVEQASWFDHVVVNDDLERATAQVAAIIAAHRTSSDASASEGSSPP
jgi:guanylate kinase